ncbi:saposin B domain-containing protein isoform X2 [Tasmannia lanceolata]|uniref:saposin B domain-containing protein isoform X2 n=2 Tax=Tasmannia lanceolata TaxID=3420 RepID=UPI004064C57B
MAFGLSGRKLWRKPSFHFYFYKCDGSFLTPGLRLLSDTEIALSITGTMGVRLGLSFLLVLSLSWGYADARSLVISDALDVKNERVCTLCEQFAAQAIYYLGENKTEVEIIDTLHQACSRLHSFKQECVSLVDYYAPLFFVEIALVDPADFCRKVNLCEEVPLVLPQKYQGSCVLCHHAVVEVLTKLKDPDTQLEIIEVLLKACDKVDKNYTKECKKLVFEYGPLILANAEQFLETTDICTSIHACKPSSSEEANKYASLLEISLSEFEAGNKDS